MEACPRKTRGKNKNYSGEWRGCEVCGTQKYWQLNQLEHGEGKFCSRACKHVSQTGKSPRSRSGIGHRYVNTTNGYVYTKVKPGKQYELEHRVMMALLQGRVLEDWEEVHHLDLDRSHNCPGNLELHHNGEHQHLHNQLNPQSRKVSVTCALPGCGVVMQRKLSRAKGNVYCGNAHKLIVAHQKAAEYHAKNRENRGYHPEWNPTEARYVPYGPNWPAQSRRCLERDGSTCQHCGSIEHLHAAHIIARGRFALDQYEEANTLENLITLCKSCHTRFDAQQGIR